MAQVPYHITVEKHSHADKDFAIHVGWNNELTLYVDYDDVDHEAVDALVDDMVTTLRRHWTYSNTPTLDKFGRWVLYMLQQSIHYL